MFYSHIVVKKPENCVIYPRNNYVYYTAMKIYIKEKKHNQNKRILIGKMIDQVNMIPNDNAREFFPEWFEDDLPPELSDTLMIGNTILIDHIMNELQISPLLESIFGSDTPLIKDLTQYMIIEETTTIQHFLSLMRRLPVFSHRIYSDSTISRFLKDKIKYRDTDLFLKSWNNMHKSEAVYISYDSTNINTFGEGIELAEYGHAKENNDFPVVNLSYAVDQIEGVPLFYQTYAGSIIDNSQLYYMLDKAKEYGYEEIGIILDRGYFSGDNIRKIVKAGYDVIMMVKTNQAVIKEMITKYRLMIADQVDTYIPEYEVNGKTFRKKLYSEHDEEYYVHIYYDAERASTQKKILLNSYAKIEKELEKKVSETKLLKEEKMKRYEKIFKMTYDGHGYLIKYKKKTNEIQKEVDRLGYFVLVTTEKKSAGEALEIYRNRDVVEKLFRSLKSELDFNRFRVHDDASMESKVFVTFLANIVRNEIYLRTKKLKEISKKNYTVPAIIQEMNKIEITRDHKNKYIRRYGLTKKQKDILKQFDIKEGAINEYVNAINMRVKNNDM